MRIAFFGTPDFAVATLDKIVEEGYSIVGVFTAPDKPSGRGQQMSISAVKKYAMEHNLPLYQPERLKNKEFITQYKALEVDIAVVVAFRMMPEVLWSAPIMGTFNLHGSLLPQYQGAAPINWAIINGEKQTGVTTFFINSEIDKGEIILQETCDILPEDDFGTMYEKLKTIGARLVVRTLKNIENNKIETYPQVFSTLDKPAPKITKEVLEINNIDSCETINNLVRGLIPVYKPYFIHKDKKYIVKKGQVEKCIIEDCDDTVITDNKSYIKLVCKDGYYNVLEIQAEGKKPMDIRSFFNGNTL